MGRYLEIARRVIEEQDRRMGAQPIAPQPVPAELPVADPYAELMQKALCQIAVLSYQSGMILWLESAHPALYSELISHLPDEVHRLWSERAPLEQFEEVLSRLVWTHREGCKLYREHLASRTKPDAVQKSLQIDFGMPTDEGEAK